MPDPTPVPDSPPEPVPALPAPRYPGTGPIPRAKLAAWVSFVQANARMMQRLGGQLDAHGVDLNTYDILVQLSEAGGSMRLKDLLNKLVVVVSQPGLSRRVERLEQAGLVERRTDPHDRRGVLVRLTRQGRSTLRAAAKIHMSGVEREFAARISDAEAQLLQTVCDRIVQPADLP